MNWQEPPDEYFFILFDRTEPAENAHRYYYLAWQPTLLDDAGAVVCLWGRKGTSQRSRIVPYASLASAWPFMRSIIRRRLRHGYRIISTELFGEVVPQ